MLLLRLRPVLLYLLLCPRGPPLQALSEPPLLLLVRSAALPLSCSL